MRFNGYPSVELSNAKIPSKAWPGLLPKPTDFPNCSWGHPEGHCRSTRSFLACAKAKRIPFCNDGRISWQKRSRGYGKANFLPHANRNNHLWMALTKQQTTTHLVETIGKRTRNRPPCCFKSCYFHRTWQLYRWLPASQAQGHCSCGPILIILWAWRESISETTKCPARPIANYWKPLAVGG